MSTTSRPLQVGDRIRDNDPRFQSPARELTIVEIKYSLLKREPLRAIVVRADGSPSPSIKASSIHTDGKPRRSGWSLIQE